MGIGMPRKSSNKERMVELHKQLRIVAWRLWKNSQTPVKAVVGRRRATKRAVCSYRLTPATLTRARTRPGDDTDVVAERRTPAG